MAEDFAQRRSPGGTLYFQYAGTQVETLQHQQLSYSTNSKVPG